MNGRKCSEIEVTYDVLIPFVAEIEITPAADGKNVASLKEFTLTFKNVFEAGIDENSTENVQLFDKDGNEVAYASKDAGIEIPVPDSMEDPMNVIKITLNKEITAKGEYKLVVPAALFILDNENSNEAS